MRARSLMVTIVLVLAVIGGWSRASDARPKKRVAPASIDAELITLHAFRAAPMPNGKGPRKGMDPRLASHAALRRPPFDAYDTFRLLKRSGAILAPGMSWKTRLPNGLDLMVGLASVIVPKKADEPLRFVIKTSIAKSGSTSFEPLGEVETTAGETFFVQARGYRAGIVVVGVKLLAK